jgi:sec-independent protein translocase protein TatA
MSSIGLPEIAIVLLIVLVIFGPKRLPQLGRSLGSGMREFKDAVTGKNKDDDVDAIEPPASAKSDDSSATRAKTADAS